MSTAGPLIPEKRAKRLRVCLGCGTLFVTVAAIRLCRVCTMRAEALSFGLVEVGVITALTRGRRV